MISPPGAYHNDKCIMINPPGRTITGGLMKTLHREAGGEGVATGCCILPKFLENRMELKENENKMERGGSVYSP